MASPEVRNPDDLVTWSPGRKRIEALVETHLATVILTNHTDLLTATYKELDNGYFSCLDLAIRFGHKKFAAELAACGVPCYHKFVVDDFIKPAVPTTEVNSLSFHFKWVLDVPSVDAALHAGVNFLGMLASHSTHAILRHPFSLLDAAILGGYQQQAVALAERGVESALGHELVSYLLIDDGPGSYWLDTQAIRTALASGIRVDTMYINIQQIDFNYPMKKEMRPFLLLDVAICLGLRDIAVLLATHGGEKLAVQGTIQSALTETNLICREVLFPMRCWRTGRKGNFPNENGSLREEAAVAATSVLDLTRSQAFVEYFLLLMQWHQQCTRHCNGATPKWEPGLLLNIFRYMLPKQALVVPPHVAPRGATRMIHNCWNRGE